MTALGMLLAFAGSVLVYSGVKGRDVRELITSGFSGAKATGSITRSNETAAQLAAGVQAGRTHDPHDSEGQQHPAGTHDPHDSEGRQRPTPKVPGSNGRHPQ